MSSSYQARWYKSPINLPEKTSGKVSIRHRILPASTEIPIVGFRQALLRGLRPASAILNKPLRVHELYHEDRGVWMTDLPEELNQIAEMTYTINPRGTVLVGGLGLGILASTLVERIDVTTVTVVEIDPDVIRLCSKPGYEVINVDLNEFLRTTKQKFDFYILDTWQGTNEGTWWKTVFPLRRIIRQRWGKKPVIHCWAEDIMLGQVFRTLTTKIPHWYYEGLPLPMSEKVARQFLRDVGLPTWEKRYGKILDNNVKNKS